MKSWRDLEKARVPVEEKWQPGGQDEIANHEKSSAVLSDRASAVAAASHSLGLEMRPPPQEPLSIM